VEFDQLLVHGSAALGGTLQVNVLPGFVASAGQSFEFLISGAGVSGAFTNMIAPTLPNSLIWQLTYGLTSVRLSLLQEPGTGNPAGDYNRDGMINAADFVVWRKAFGHVGSSLADGNGDGRVDDADYVLWKRNFGRQAQPPASGAATSVPEPSAAVFAVLAAVSMWATRRRPHAVRPRTQGRGAV
jgi:hypothetical protein